MTSDGLKAVGVPVVNLAVGCVDSRNFSEGQINTPLKAFAEMLAGKPSPWRQPQKF
jgi:benzoyl-CoA reductase/2-hydroxyglutaryl-CoA dehydratase subunit BcrC/BadD/HgdB